MTSSSHGERHGDRTLHHAEERRSGPDVGQHLGVGLEQGQGTGPAGHPRRMAAGSVSCSGGVLVSVPTRSTTVKRITWPVVVGVRVLELLAGLAAAERLVGRLVDEVQLGPRRERTEVDDHVRTFTGREQQSVHRDRLRKEPPSPPTCQNGVTGADGRTVGCAATASRRNREPQPLSSRKR